MPFIPSWLRERKKRKDVILTLRISVPEDVTKAEAAREIRTLIREQCYYSAEPEDVRVRACSPAEDRNPKKTPDLPRGA